MKACHVSPMVIMLRFGCLVAKLIISEASELQLLLRSDLSVMGQSPDCKFTSLFVGKGVYRDTLQVTYFSSW